MSHSRILSEVLNVEIIDVGIQPPQPIKPTPTTDCSKYCHFHRSQGHDANKRVHLKDAIEELIHLGKLSRFVKRDGDGRQFCCPEASRHRRSGSWSRSPFHHHSPPRRSGDKITSQCHKSHAPRRDHQSKKVQSSDH
ncbi:hypothetical protein SESBI_39015 [Sesbania bispinosa]|nr:hypothetical protein SESBI_39015 [Sesbania bispinosa]